MARIRTIKPEFPQSESMGRVSRDARLLFVQLWTLCDDEGRTRAASRMLASLLFPYDDDAPALVDLWLDELEREECVVRYLVGGASYLQVCNWQSHQKIDKPSGSKIPPFDETSRIISKPREVSSEDQGSRIKEGKGKGSSLAPSPADSTPVAFEFPCSGNGGKTFPIREAQVEAWAKDFPAVDVPQQLRTMRAWLEANPTKRKTVVGVPRFVVAWLGKEQNTPKAASGPSRTSSGSPKRITDAPAAFMEQVAGLGW